MTFRARDGSRTHTPYWTHGPQPCLSTNSSTRAKKKVKPRGLTFCDLTGAHFDKLSVNFSPQILLRHKPLVCLFTCDLTGARTQDHLLKREVLYQLSYQVNSIKTSL